MVHGAPLSPKMYPLLEPIKLQAYHTFGWRNQHQTHTLRAKYQHIFYSCCRNKIGPEQWRQVTCMLWLRTSFGWWRRWQQRLIEAHSNPENRKVFIHLWEGTEPHFKSNIAWWQPTNFHIEGGEHHWRHYRYTSDTCISANRQIRAALCGQPTIITSLMALPHREFLIKETPSSLCDWSPTDKPTDFKSPQVCGMYVRQQVKTLLEDQVNQQPQKTLNFKVPGWIRICILVGIIQSGFHLPTKGQT